MSAGSRTSTPLMATISLLIRGLATCAALTSNVHAQPYDFSDLGRDGPRESTDVALKGFGAKSKSLSDEIITDETSRTLARDAARATQPSRDAGTAAPPAPDRVQQQGKQKPADKTYSCTIYCNSSSGPRIRQNITAASRADAARAAGNQADQLCKSSGYSKSSSLSLPEGQCVQN
jgi:hypothetical protein